MGNKQLTEENSMKRVQEQAQAAWIAMLNQMRLNELIEKLKAQDINLKEALEIIAELKEFINNPEHILGRIETKHGEIAEHIQVDISNAKRVIEGLEKEYTFKNVGRTAPEDYLYNGIKVQSKFCNGLKNTLDAIDVHLEKYPDFVKKDGYYQIPKDQYKKMIDLIEKNKIDPHSLRADEQRLLNAIEKFQEKTGIDIYEDIKPSIAKYKDVQIKVAEKTVDREKNEIKKTDKERRKQAYEETKPTLKEGAKTTVISAATEGGLAFCLSVAKKMKEGKKLSEFSQEDWKAIGIESATGTMKGAIRGGSVYTLTNFAHTPANIATAYVTAVCGVLSQAYALKNETITKEDFLINSEVLCLDVTISTISAMVGQTIIPVPVLGAIIGSVAGEFVYKICKNSANKKEAELISIKNLAIQDLENKYHGEAIKILESLKAKMNKFNSIEEMVFDEELNADFLRSIERARVVGVDEEKMLKSLSEIDEYFEN